MSFVVSSSLILLINISSIHLLLTRKRSIKYAISAFIINYLIFIVLYTYTDKFFKYALFYKYLLYILCFSFIIYIFLVFEESISKKIFSMFTIWVFSNINSIICTDIIKVLSVHDSKLHIYLIGLLRVFTQLLFLPIIWVYFKDTYKEVLRVVSNKIINVISIYSIMIFLLSINNFHFYSLESLSYYEVFNNFLTICAIVLSYLMIFIAISSVNRNMALEYKLKNIDIQVEMQKKNYKTLNEALEKYYAFKHDIRHHFLAIKLLINSKNYVAASEYLNKFSENEIYLNIDMLCRNFTVDSILKYYMGIAVNNDIDFRVNANIPEDIMIDNADLSIVIGNCVENAIEACKNITDKKTRYIDLKAEIIGSQLVIKINNIFDGQVIKEGKMIKTIKNGQGHGIGLSNVRNIAEKYNGHFDVKYMDNEFQVSIIININ